MPSDKEESSVDETKSTRTLGGVAITITLFVSMFVIPWKLSKGDHGKHIGSPIVAPFPGLCMLYTGTASVSSVTFMLLYAAWLVKSSTIVSARHRERLLTASFWIPTVISLVLFSPLMFQLLLLAFNVISLHEYQTILASSYVMPKGRLPSRVPLLAAAAVVGLACLPGDFTASGAVLLLCAAFMASWYPILYGAEARKVLSLDVLGLVYVSWNLSTSSYLLAKNHHGSGLVFLMLSCSWVGDGGAYFIGSKYGRHKCLPQVSPGKSIEGVIAELFWTSLIALILFALSNSAGIDCINLPPSLNVEAMLAVSLLFTCGGVFGDLCESFIKRLGGFKDSGDFFKGHGGVLDRFDGFFFCSPMLATCVLLLQPTIS